MKIKKINILSILLFLAFSGAVNASNKTCTGKITSIQLNTDYNKDNIRYVINDVHAELHGSHWSEDMSSKVYSLMLSAQMSGKTVEYWGTEDCKSILKFLRLAAE